MYTVEYISCKICGRDEPRWLGTRGNREHAGAAPGADRGEHMVTNVVRCHHCGFIYTNPLILNATGPDAGYGEAESYEASAGGDPAALFNAIIDRIETWWGGPPGRLLDVGCGKGEFLEVVRRRGWQVTGIERSTGMAAHAAKALGLEVFCGTLEQARWSEGAFDVVTLNMVLEHIDDPHRLVSQVARLLNDHGLLFVEVPNMDSFMLACARWYFRLKGSDWSPLLSPLHRPFHCYGYARGVLIRLARSHGLWPMATVITDTSLRGFRPEGAHGAAERWARHVLMRIGWVIGRGDILIMGFEKRGK